MTTYLKLLNTFGSFRLKSFELFAAEASEAIEGIVYPTEI